MTMERLSEIVSSVSIPVVAIGGISAGNILQLCGSGVDGVAVVSAIFAAENPGQATADLLKLAEEVVASHG
jgi:thiamine-phosphate pyrophosphorylase